MNNWNYCPQCSTKLIHDGLKLNPFVKCENCGFIKYNNPLPSVVAVIIRESDNNFLFLQRNHPPKQGEWDMVGGFIEPGESAEDCLIRETKEEINSSFSSIEFLGTHPSVYGESGFVTIGISFLCRLTDNDNLQLSQENSSYKWISPDEDIAIAFADVSAAYELAKNKLGLKKI